MDPAPRRGRASAHEHLRRSGARVTSIYDELAAARVGIVSKADSRLMRVIGWLLSLIGNDRFMVGFWTTISARTIYAPIGVDLSDLERYAVSIRHELVHARQARRLPVLWQISYLLLPMPFFFAWCRWASEREAYLVQLRAGTMTIDEVVTTLWNNYGATWPRSRMRAWFARAVLA